MKELHLTPKIIEILLNYDSLRPYINSSPEHRLLATQCLSDLELELGIPEFMARTLWIFIEDFYLNPSDGFKVENYAGDILPLFVYLAQSYQNQYYVCNRPANA